MNVVSKVIDKLKIELSWNYQRKIYLDKNEVSSNSHSSMSMHSPNTLEWQWNWEEWKNWKKIEIDKSDLIVSVVPQLISFYEEGYQFDDENWRFEKERNFDYFETIIGNEKNNKPSKWNKETNTNWIGLYQSLFHRFEILYHSYWLKMSFQHEIKFQQRISLKRTISQRW